MDVQQDSANRSLPTRRDIIRIGISGAGLGLLPERIVRGDDDVKSDLIDAHVHVWTPDTRKFPLADGFKKDDMLPPSFTPAELLAHAKPCGVTRVVLIQMSFYGYDNSYMLKTMRDFPGVYSGVAVVDENDKPATEMKTLAKQGVRGFRIRPGDQKPNEWLSRDGMQEMWKCGADDGLAMCHLINPEFLPSVEKMCQKYPRTPVVIDHFARIGVDGNINPRDLDNLCRLARFAQVSVKVSAYYALGKKKTPYRDLGPMIRRLLDTFGAERLMWASDCPFQVQENHTYAASIDLIKNGLDFLTTDDREWILRKTAERVFFA
jgi:predicted TIM-barrel fold metal-dependent hydrolase